MDDGCCVKTLPTIVRRPYPRHAFSVSHVTFISAAGANMADDSYSLGGGRLAARAGEATATVGRSTLTTTMTTTSLAWLAMSVAERKVVTTHVLKKTISITKEKEKNLR